MERLLERGLAATADAWPPIRAVYAEVYRAAHLLANHDGQTAPALAAAYAALVDEMSARHGDGPLAAAVAHFAKVTARHESRRAQWRFRKDPAAYLATLEAQLLQPSLPP
ncbi:MAG: hypothetical protein LC769_10795 [Chloroflexi bacterium]|nr:hypothetical protein [Chloroflexota bacterium]